MRTQTSKEIILPELQKRLGCSTIAFGGRRLGTKEVATIREAGITNIEICGYNPPGHYDYRDKKQVSEITSACAKQGVNIVSVHGPGIGFLYDTPYEEIRKGIVSELIDAIKAAEEMGAKIFVTHFAMAGSALLGAERSIIELLEKTDGLKIKILVENGVCLDFFKNMVDRIASARVGMVVDIGHTSDNEGKNPFTDRQQAYDLIYNCGNRLVHMHLHDFIHTQGDHFPPFDGEIAWEGIISALFDMGYKGCFMFEARDKISTQDTLVKMAGFPMEFTKRYATDK